MWIEGFMRHWSVRSGSGATFNILDIADPVPLSPLETILRGLAFKGRRRARKERSVYVFECIDADHGVGATFNLARDNRNDAALGADVKLSRFRPESVPGYQRGV